MHTLRRLAAGTTLVALLALTGCGAGSDTATDPEADTTGQAPPSGLPSGGPGGGFDADQLEQIRTCLKAAGLDGALADLPSGMPSDLPSDMPTDLPSDMTGMPSDFPSGGPGGVGNLLGDPGVRDALDACGITLPQAPTGPPS